MPASFANVNLPDYFNNVWAPGAGPFSQALKFWQNNLHTNAAGMGAPQLAAAAASGPLGPQYNATPYSGTPTGGMASQNTLSAFKALSQGQAGARGVGQQTQDQTQQGDISGALDTSSEFGNSIATNLAGDLALKSAQQQAGLSTLGQTQGIFSQIFGPTGPGTMLTGDALSPGATSVSPFDFLSQGMSPTDLAGVFGEAYGGAGGSASLLPLLAAGGAA